MVRGRGMGTLLVVDDDAAFCRALERLLAGYGHTVLGAHDLTSALDVCSRTDVNHALIDFCLAVGQSGQSGADVARAVIKHLATRHLAFITSWPERATPCADELGVEILVKPATIAQILEWIEFYEFAQHEQVSGRREVVPLRTVLYLATSTGAQLPTNVFPRIVTKTADAYDELQNRWDLVLIDGEHPAMERVTKLAIEHGCCVYVVSTDDTIQRRACDAGAVGVIGPSDLATLDTLHIRRPSAPVPVSPWVVAKAAEIIRTPLPHDEKMAILDRLLLDDAVTRHGSDRMAAAAAGLARPTFRRHLTPQGITSPHAEKAIPLTKPGHTRKR